MASVNRTAVITKLYKVLKKHYQPQPAQPSKSLLENLLFACCLENTPLAQAQQTYQVVSTAFFDWNEVRVTTVKELSEVMKAAPDPAFSANNLKKSLQGVFEGNFTFDLEGLKKLNLGVAVQKLEKCDCSPFVVSYVVQTSLGGHSVPLDSGAMGCLAVLGLVDEGASPKAGCPGMERAIPKNKGMEFGSLLHQVACEYYANPYSPKLHAFLLEVDPDCKPRLPKRQPKVVKPEPGPAPAAPAVKGKPADGKTKAAEAKTDAKGKPVEAKRTDDKKKPDAAKKPAAPAAAAPAKKPAAAAPKKPASAPAPAKKPAAKPAPALAKKKPR